MRKIIAASMITVLACSSCYQDIDMEKYRGEEYAVLNCIANSDTVVMADVSRSWFFTDSRPAGDITGLDVELYVNGEMKGLMEYDGGLYRSDVRPRQGDMLMIKTVVDGKELSASDRMPAKTTVEDVDISYRSVLNGGSNVTFTPDGGMTTSDTDDEFTYRIRLKNNPGEKRYYFINISVTDGRQSLGTLDYSFDPVFQLTSERINKTLTNLKIEGQNGLPFSNEGIGGDEFTVTVKETVSPLLYYGDDWGGRKVSLYSISEAYYRYVISLLANDSDSSWQGGFTDVGVAEPVKIFSNITGGIGIMGCLHRDACQVDLKGYRK